MACFKNNFYLSSHMHVPFVAGDVQAGTLRDAVWQEVQSAFDPGVTQPSH